MVETYATERGPRPRLVAYLGDMDQAERSSVKEAATGQEGSWQSRLFDEEDGRYIVGTPKSRLKRFERELLAANWQTVRSEYTGGGVVQGRGKRRRSR